jgi:hypothetical protein
MHERHYNANHLGQGILEIGCQYLFVGEPYQIINIVNPGQSNDKLI